MKAFPISSCCRRRLWVVAVLMVGIGLLLTWASSHYGLSRRGREAVLCGLRDELNANYGYREGSPRINYGPCGRFAKVFREQWNARFREKINLAFIMTADKSRCHHVLLKFRDGSYFDGGNGVISERRLLTVYPPDSRIEEMVEFDLSLLDQRVGGLDHDSYRDCPNYSDSLTLKLIVKHLAMLPSDIDENSRSR